MLVIVLLMMLNPERIVAAWWNLRPGWLGLALLGVLPNMLAQTGRLRTALHRVYPSIGWWTCLRMLLVGLGLGAATPGRMGEMGLAAFLPAGGRRKAFGTLTVMKIYSLSAMIAFGLTMWFLVPGLLPVLKLDVTLGRIITIAGLVLVIAIPLVGEAVCRVSRNPKLLEMKYFGNMLIGVQALRLFDRVAFAAWTWVGWGVYLTQLVWLVRAFGGDVTWFEGVAAGGVAMAFVSVMPVSIGNIGIREGAVVATMEHFSVSAPVAFNGAFVLFIMNIVLPGLIGMIWNTRNGVKENGSRSAAGNSDS